MLAREASNFGKNVELREEHLVGEPPHPVQLLGRLGEQVVRHAGLVRAGAAEERPRVNDQRPAAHRPQVRRAEPAAGTTADEHRVVARVGAGVMVEVEHRLGPGVGQAPLDQLVPLGEVEMQVPDVHVHSVLVLAGMRRPQERDADEASARQGRGVSEHRRLGRGEAGTPGAHGG